MTIKKEFSIAIKLGIGKAHLILKQYSNIDFSNEIIKASINCLSYDNQAEGSRAKYLFELIQLSIRKEKIRIAILNALKVEKSNTWVLEQLFELALMYAKLGDKEAKKIIYKRYLTKIIHGSEWVGESVILELDGINGLKYIADKKGIYFKKHPHFYDDDFLINSFQQENPNIDVIKELKNESKKNFNIRYYLKICGKNSVSTRVRKKIFYNYKTISKNINDKIIVPAPPSAIKRLSKSDIKKLAKDFLKESDRIKLEKYLRVFNYVKFPFDYAPILLLAKKQYLKSDRMIEFAAGALQYFFGIDIREFAIKKIKLLKNPNIYIDMLVKNYKKSDANLLVFKIKNLSNDDDIHSMIWGLIKIYNANNCKSSKKPLEQMYLKMNCGIHRQDIINLLKKNKVLSKKINSEIQFDSNEEIRKLYTKKNKFNKSLELSWAS